VLIDVAAAGVNFPDVLIVQGKYQFKAPLPFAPGCELAGTVRAVGEDVTHVKPGDRVLAIVQHGAFAQQVSAQAARVMPLPPGVDLERAAAMMFTYGTSYHALKDRAQLSKGETLLVLGAAGGVGLAAVELGKLLGARVIAAASTPEKLETCKNEGADLTIDYTSEDLKERTKALTGGAGADVIYDPVGGRYSEAALRATAWQGRHLVVGFAAGEIPKIPLNLTLLKGASIVGVFWGQFTMREPARARAQFTQLLEWVRDGRLTPYVYATPPLAEAARAIRALAERKVQGKIVLVV